MCLYYFDILRLLISLPVGKTESKISIYTYHDLQSHSQLETLTTAYARMCMILLGLGIFLFVNTI